MPFEHVLNFGRYLLEVNYISVPFEHVLNIVFIKHGNVPLEQAHTLFFVAGKLMYICYGYM